jgi:hypothetical protein
MMDIQKNSSAASNIARPAQPPGGRGAVATGPAPVIMSYQQWLGRLGRSGQAAPRGETMIAIADALQAYTNDPKTQTLKRLGDALARWRRQWQSGPVSPADPTMDLYDQVKRTLGMQWGDPAHLVRRLAYETRVGVLALFANMHVDMSITTELFESAIAGVTMGLDASPAGEKFIAPLTSTGAPAPLAADVMEKAMSGYKGDVLIGSAEKAWIEHRHEVLSMKAGKVAQGGGHAEKAALLKKLQALVMKIWHCVRDCARRTFGIFAEKMFAYLEDPMGFSRELSQLLLEALLPKVPGYSVPFQNAVRLWTPIASTLLERVSAAGGHALAVNSDLHAGILESVNRGLYWKAWESVILGAVQAATGALHVAHAIPAKLARAAVGLVDIIVRLIVRRWERGHLRALIKEARARLAESGHLNAACINVDVEDPGQQEVTAARRAAEFDEWFLNHLRAPAVGALVLKHKVCDPAAFFWVFDNRGYVRQQSYVAAQVRLDRFQAASQAYLASAGLHTATIGKPSAITGRWEAPADVKAAAMLALPPREDEQAKTRKLAATRALHANYFAMR